MIVAYAIAGLIAVFIFERFYLGSCVGNRKEEMLGK